MPGNPLHDVFSSELRLSHDEKQMAQGLAKRIETSECTGCSLHEERAGHPPVPGEGSGRIMFVGHRIGRQEAHRNRPAIGEASQHGLQLLMNVLPVDNSRMTDYQARKCILDYAYISNGARCGKNADPGKSHWSRCAGPRGPNWLAQEVGLVDPEIIVFWKKQVARTVLGDEPPPRGEVEVRDVYGQDRPVMVMTHPVFVARQPDEKPTVEGDYKRLVRWLWENDLMEREPNFDMLPGANHHLITTEEGLEQMLEDLWDKDWIAIDTETFFDGDLQHMQEVIEGGHEAKKGALLWHHPNFETVCYQAAGLEFDENGHGIVDNTYTVAMRFRDRLTGDPKQDISPEEAIDALDELLRHDPQPVGFDEPVTRKVCMWNALFDCPVLSQEGLDMWGLTHRDYNIEIWDGQILLGRMNEHMGGKEGRTTLDNASSIYLQERKGSFTDRFDVDTFAYEDIEKDYVREAVLDYCGEDPRKTLLVTWRLFGELDHHVQQRSEHLTDTESRIPVMGFQPFACPGESYTGSRIQDVAIPLDHQMIPLIGEMEMLGFKLDQSGFETSKRYVDECSNALEGLIQDEVPGYNPNSSPDAIAVLERAMQNVADEMNRLIGLYPEQTREIQLGFQLNPNRVGDQVTASDIESAFERGYGELNAQKKTIKNKFLVFYEVSLRLLREEAEKLGEEITLEPENRPERLKQFFDRVFLFKQVGKKWGTYFERFREMADRQSVIHPGYLLISTLSGRFSGNFQNVPRGGEEDLEFVEDLLEAMNVDIPEDEDEKSDLINEYNRFDVRQSCYPVQPEDLNPMLERMNLTYQSGPKEGQPWQVREDDRYVVVAADFAAQEDRMAYALSGDETKARLLSNPELDTHFYNVAFCFGGKHGIDTSTEEGMMNAYHLFTKQRQVAAREDLIRKIVEAQREDGDNHGLLNGDTYAGDVNYAKDDFDEDPGYEDLSGRPASEVIERLRDQIGGLKSQKKNYKRKYRTPMKTVHYASQYGAGAQKLHTVIKPIFMQMGEDWSISDTEELKAKYDELYSGVTQSREEILDQLEQIPYLEYPVYGTLRHANVDMFGDVQDGLSAANAYNQGTSAYITKTAMLRMRHLIEMNAKRWNLVQAGGDTYVGTLLQVHDEIAIICPARLAGEVAKALESAMKIVVEPEGKNSAHPQEPYFSQNIKDARGDTGWLVIPDEKFEGRTLFDADAEVKATVAKAKTLANGEKNLLALMDEPETMQALKEKYPPEGINENHELILGRRGEANGYLF